MLRSIPRDWPRRSTVMPRPQPSVQQVVADLESGTVDSLAAHIRDRHGQIDQQVALALYDLIVGGKERIGFRMVLEHHPDRLPAEKSTTDASNELQKLAAAVGYYHRVKAGRPDKVFLGDVLSKFEIGERRLREGLALRRKSEGFSALCDEMGSRVPD